MKKSPPSAEDLSRMYYELGQAGARAVGAKKAWAFKIKNLESLFVLAADWSRFDPRLLEILVEYAARHWADLNPLKLRESIKSMTTPQTIGVIAALVRCSLPADKEPHFFWDYVTAGLQPAATQYYFSNLYTLGSDLARRAAVESPQEFKRWGFLAIGHDVGSWDKSSRLNILNRLLDQKKKVQISDYLKALKDSISRQQALLDLQAAGAMQCGRGRGAYWEKKT